MRLTLLSAAILMVSAQANADIEPQLAQCAAMTDKLERLLCYDNLAANNPITGAAVTHTSAPATPLVSPVAAQTVAAAPQSPNSAASNIDANFGLQAESVQEESVDKIYLDVEAITEDPYGTLKITFTNGQVWKQTEGRKYNLKMGDKVFIEKAALGLFLMGTENHNAKVRVKRLK